MVISLCNLCATALRKGLGFRTDKRGNVAMIFALAIIPLLMAVGVSVDYVRSADAEATMQSAADSAAIAAAVDGTLAPDQKTMLAAREVARSMSGKAWINYDPASLTLTIGDSGTHTVAFNAKINTTVMGALGFDTLSLSTTATAIAGSDKSLEIALALDNTGSMANDMTGLKAAASGFLTAVFQKAPKGKLKVGIVPFVAAVNPGKQYIDNAQMSDYLAQSENHGYLLNFQWSRGIRGCDWPPSPPCTVNCGGGGPAWTGPGKGGGSDKKTTFLGKSWLERILGHAGAQFAYATSELIGMKAAHAQSSGGTTPATDFNGMNATWVPYNFTDPRGVVIPLKLPANGNAGNNFVLPNNGQDCAIQNPKVNHFDLFNRIPGASWKGCVEARPDPYDVTDEPPNNSDPNSKFVPYFWRSEPTVDGTIHAANNPFSNNYLANFPPVASDFLDQAGFAQPNDYNSVHDLMKYSGTNNGSTIAIQESGPDTAGPNRACPNAVTPLTDNVTTLQSEINNLVHWYGGGTVTSEGLMWAWRVLSPNLPYATAAAYDKTKVDKYIVLMSDGVNDVQDNGPRDSSGLPNSDVYSDYTAYGALTANRGFAPGINHNWGGINNFTDARAALNERFQTACANAKAKGIVVYTIYFREDDPTAINYLQQCSGVNNFYKAANAIELQGAFAKIAASIYAVRLSR